MKKCIFLVLIVFIFGLTRASFAGTSKEAADFLVQAGETHLKDGQIQEAIHEFSKALMIQPNHPQAVRHLSSFGLNDGLYKNSQTHLSVAAQLAEQVRNYQEKMAALESEKADIEAKFQGVQQDHEQMAKSQMIRQLEEETIQAKKVVAESSPQVPADAAVEQAKIEVLGVSIEPAAENISEPVVDVSAAGEVAAEANISDDKSLLAEKTEIVKVQEANQFDADFLVHQAKFELMAQHEEELARLREQHREFEQLASDQTQKKEKLISVMEEYLTIREDQMEDLKDDVLLTRLDLAHSQISSLAKTEDLIQLNGLQERYADRLQARDEIIAKRSDDLQFLNSRMDDVYKDIAQKQRVIHAQQNKISMLEEKASE